MKIDKLNVVEKPKILTIEKYFGEMPLTDEQKKKRIDMCEDFEVFLLYIIELGEELDRMQLDILIGQLQMGFIEIASKHLDMTEAIIERINEDAMYIAETTKKNLDVPFFTSPDRARLVAENETQSLFNLSEFDRAKEQGFKFDAIYTGYLGTEEEIEAVKGIIRDFADEKTRETHALADGQKVDIDTPFIVGNSLMMFPTDTSLGAPPEEIINCRCIMRYSRTF